MTQETGIKSYLDQQKDLSEGDLTQILSTFLMEVIFKITGASTNSDQEICLARK